MFRSTRHTVSIVLAFSLSLLVACGSTAESRFYVLTPTAAAAPGTSELAVAVDPVVIPSVLDRPQIVTRVDEHERKLAEFARWAEPFADNVSYVLAENLATLLGTAQVSLTHAAGPADYRVSVRILRLDATPGVDCTLQAYWRIAGPDGQPPIAKRTTHTMPLASEEFGDVVATMNAALTALAQEVAKAIQAQANG